MRLILSLIVLAALLAPGARGQVTTDQLNKLSLESLTAPPPRGSGGYAPMRPRTVYRAPSRYYRAPRHYDAPRHAYHGRHLRRAPVHRPSLRRHLPVHRR